MTATLERPAPPAEPTGRAGSSRPTDPSPRAGWDQGFGARTPAGRTVRVWLGLLLGLTPLFTIVSDARWFVVGVGATAVAIGPAWALRWAAGQQPARVWQVLPGLILLPFYLTAAAVGQGAVAGVVPTGRTWTAVSQLHSELVTTIARSTAPLVSTPGIRLGLAVLLGLGAIMVDILCVVLEAPAMVGVVLVPVLVLSGATVRSPVAWYWFVLAALGYLLILSTTGPHSRGWGRRIGSRPPGAPATLVSGRRIAAIGVFAAVLLPFAVGGVAHNAISDALHSGGTSGSGGDGTGGVTEFAALKGSLTRSEAVNLMTVTVPAGLVPEPYYLRQSVLDLFTPDGWIPAGREDSRTLARSGLTQSPARPDVADVAFRADIAVTGLDGRPVTFGDTVGAAGLPGDTRWDAAHGTLQEGTVSSGDRYSVAVEQPDPTDAELTDADGALPAAFPDVWRSVPTSLPTSVTTLTQQVVGAAQRPYDIAKTLQTFFTTATNGFSYSLDVPEGDSGNQLADFLTNRRGFCQQYAAAMAVMLRVAGVPSRVVVGYTHVAPDRDGRFTVTTRDAHAWVEAYVGGIGWVSFDPTPLTGNDATRQVDLPYLSTAAPTVGASTSTGGPTGAASGPAASSTRDPLDLDQSTAAAGAAGGPDRTGLWVGSGLGLLAVAVAATPAVARRRTRRNRLRGGDVERQWDELRDTAVDLGWDWSPARSPRATAAWLVGRGAPADALGRLVAAVESARYGRRSGSDAGATSAAGDDVGSVLRSMRHSTGRTARWRAAWWPTSTVLAFRRAAVRRWEETRAAFRARVPGR